MFQMMKNSPWFTKIREENGGEFPHNINLSSGSRPSANVGRAIFASVMTEVNFSSYKSEALLPMTNFNLIYRRMQSRFMNKERQPFPLIIDSSISDDNDMVSQIKRNFKTAKLSVHEFAIWQIKPRHKFRPDTFKVFCGDESVDPFIITDENDAVAQMVMTDPNTQHRVIDVPMDFYSAFTSDLRTSIRDIAGVATSANVGFITSPKMITDCCSLPNPITKQILRIGISDQYRDTHLTSVFDESYWDRFEPVDELSSFEDDINYRELAMFNGTYTPPADKSMDTRPRSFHIDLGIVKDLTGISCSYVDKYDVLERVDPRTGNTGHFKEPYYISEWTMFVGAAPNDEVPIYKIRDFFLDLRTRGVPIWKITLDGFQSRQIKQELITMGFDCEIISVDRNKEPYLTFKRAMLEGRWKSADNARVKRELRELIDTGRKIDHPDVGEDGDGSKDGTDAIVGSLWNLFSEQGNTELEAQEVDAEDIIDGLLDNEPGFFELEVSGSRAMDAFNRMLNRR
ncbi:terminase large subunit [Vibrio phage 150E35-1]|nr:terminase large subunit [Vibrio phage 150E35-1]